MTKPMTKELAQELVGLFDLTGWHDMQESLYADLSMRSAEEMAEQFGRVADLLRGLEYTAESSLGFGASLILGEARRHAEIACSMCKTFREEVVDRTR